MKKILLPALAVSVFLGSCSSDDNNVSDQLPGNAKYVKTVNVVNTMDGVNETLTVNYNTDGSVSGVTDGFESSTFVYDDNDKLTTMTGSNDVLTTAELYQAPYNGYDVGQVLEFDGNGNPKKVRLFERDWDDSIMAEYTCEITYESQKNFFLHTLEKAGILNVLDNIDIDFAATQNGQNLTIARDLLPINNPKSYTIKNSEGTVITTMQANYVYDSAGYPTSSTFTLTKQNGEVSVSTATYTYL